MLSYRFRDWLDCLSRRSNKLTTVSLVKIMCPVRTHWIIDYVAINKWRGWILPGNLDPLRIEVILADIRMIWNVTHGDITLCCFSWEMNVVIRRRIQTTTTACIRHHNQLQSARMNRVIRARAVSHAQVCCLQLFATETLHQIAKKMFFSLVALKIGFQSKCCFLETRKRIFLP